MEVAAITPTYEFWTNWWRVVSCSGVGPAFFVPYGHQSVDEGRGPRFLHRQFLPSATTSPRHNLTPVGDLVVYLSTNLAQTIDNRGPAANTVTLTPGLRTHLGGGTGISSAPSRCR